MEIWINPECSKCQIAMDTLEAAKATYTVRRYLDDPPTTTEIKDVLDRLGLEPWDITRIHEPIAQEIGLAALTQIPNDRDKWIDALAQYPILIQRPIITAEDGSATVARD